MTEIAITPAGAERIDDVEPLWHAMHAARSYERRGLVPYLRLTIGRVPPAP